MASSAPDTEWRLSTLVKISREIFRHSYRSRGHPSVAFALLSCVLLSDARNRTGCWRHCGRFFPAGTAWPAGYSNSYFARWYWCGSGGLLCFVSRRFSSASDGGGFCLHGLPAWYDPDLTERLLLVSLV